MFLDSILVKLRAYRGAVADEQTMKTRRWTPVCFASQPCPPLPPTPSPACLSADDLSARRAAHVAAVSGRTCAMSLSNSQELPNTSLPRPCNRPRDTQTHTCTHRASWLPRARQPTSSSPDNRNLLYFSWNNNSELIDSDCTMLNVGCAAQSSSYMLRVFFCNITVNTVDWMLKGLAKHAWRRTKHSTAVQVSFLAKLCPVLPTCRLWR